MARTVKSNAWNEVFALILLGVGTLLFLALISYTPKDVPSWIWFSQFSSPNRPAQNFIGPFGAIIAGFSYLMLGAASYLLAVVLLGFGGAKLFHAKLRVAPRLGHLADFGRAHTLHSRGSGLPSIYRRITEGLRVTKFDEPFQDRFRVGTSRIRVGGCAALPRPGA